jgi:hypothetical protein
VGTKESYLYKDDRMIIQKLKRDTYISNEDENKNFNGKEYFQVKSD